ncbi:MAG: tetratricopeptide repeat protein, partial [Desulfuromonadales bacterium]|nr:tetratricopeptide repeat protein [Desulfuromonadales bacterium]
MTEQNQQSSLLGKIAAYTEILARDPKSTIFVSLGESYRKMGMLDDARQVIEKGLTLFPDFSPAHIVLGRILCQQGEYVESEAAFQKALDSDNESLAALVGFSRLLILLGRAEHARELLLKARPLSPADPIINKLLLSLPEESLNTEDQVAVVTEEQVPTTEEISEESSEKPLLASSTLAELYLKQGLSQQALDMYHQLSAEDPNNLVLRRKIRDLEDSQLTTEAESEQGGVSPDENIPGTEIPTAGAAGDDTLETSEPDVSSEQESVSADSCETLPAGVMAESQKTADSMENDRS